GLPVLDSVGELSFDSLGDFHDRLYDSPEGERIIAADVRGFMGGADAYATTEHVQKTRPAGPVGTRTPGVKLVCPIRRRDDMTHAAFVAHWLERHVPLALRHHPGLVQYVTNVVDAPLGADAPPLDGIGELHFASAEDLATKMFAGLESERAIR